MFEKKQIRKELESLKIKLENQKSWDDYSKVSKALKKQNYLSNFLDCIDNAERNFNDTVELLKITDENTNKEMYEELEKELRSINKNINNLHIETLMSGKADSRNVLMEIHSGAGGIEAQDWVEMLLRMYSRWAESKKFKLQIVDQSIGDEAGLKSVTIKIDGDKAYGWLKLENGVHRLVRISPFDSQSRRHTSFASVFCYPEIDNTINVNLLDKDLKVDTFRSSGAGGQHVNTTDSAVRITHTPSKIVVQCQNERSQHKNKETCMNMLKARLYDYEIKKREKENQDTESSKSEIGWGHQIRSYVLQPYQLVKDNRTNFESSSPDKVLNGEIDEFLEQSLYQIK